MPNGGADCHCHTHYSDGTFTPSEVMERARDVELEAIAITDHDCLDGLEEGEAAARRTGVELIPGIEITVYEEDAEIHILGLFIDRHHPELNQVLKTRKEARSARLRGMISKLREAGLDIDTDELIRQSGKGVIGRLHVARYLVEKGYCADTDAAFKRYLSNKASCYVPNRGFPAAQAIRLIRDAGGVAVMAHPYFNHKDNLIGTLKEAGMRGLEVYHPGHPPKAVRRYKRMALEHDLLISGGSDCHGMAKGQPMIGHVRISKDQLEKIKGSRG